MMRIVLVGLLLMLAGPVLGQDATVARQTTQECYRKNSIDLDDLTSDARTIGQTVSFICGKVERAQVKASAYLSDADAERFYLDTKAAFINEATIAVLMRRVMIRNGTLKP